MAWIPTNDAHVPWRNTDGVVLKASARITSSETTTAVEMGKGMFTVVIDVTEVHQESGFDNVVFWIEANKKSATSTYEQIGVIPIGDATGTGIALGSTGVGTYPVVVHNPRDNGIRLNVDVLGSTDGITYSAKIYPGTAV